MARLSDATEFRMKLHATKEGGVYLALPPAVQTGKSAKCFAAEDRSDVNPVKLAMRGKPVIAYCQRPGAEPRPVADVKTLDEALAQACRITTAVGGGSSGCAATAVRDLGPGLKLRPRKDVDGKTIKKGEEAVKRAKGCPPCPPCGGEGE